MAIFACHFGRAADTQVIERVTATAGPITPLVAPSQTPTPTNIPTPFPSPTPTVTHSPTSSPATPAQTVTAEPPNYASLMIFPGDLPAGFLPFPDSQPEELLQVGDYFNMQTEIRSVFYYGHPETFELVHGFTTLQSTTFEQNSFDLSFHQQQFRHRLFGPNVEVEEVTTAETVGDASVLLTAAVEIEGISYQQNCIAFRQNTIGAVMCYVYPRTIEPSISAIEIAQLLDQRIVLLLSSN
jgi:hypothetical protein